MTTMIVRFRVREFERWKAVFDSVAKQREEHGIVDASVHRNVEDRDMIVTILEARSLDVAKSWGNSDALRAAMARAGVEDIVEVEYLEDVE